MREENIIRIRDWLFNLGFSFITILRIALLSKFRNEIKVNIEKEIIVLGNGPSLGKTIDQHQEKFKNISLMCVNLFCNSDYYEQLKPQHYVVASPNMWSDNPHARTVEKKEVLWNQIGSKTNWPLNLYLPYDAKKASKWKLFLGVNKHINIIYYNRTPIEGFTWFCHLFFKLGLGMPRPHNVILPSLFLTVNLGFKKIVLVGADHSWLLETYVDGNNNVLISQKHFYDENEVKPEGMINNKDGSRKLHEVLEKWMISFKSYFTLREYAESKGAQIFNATPVSFIDAFERIKL